MSAAVGNGICPICLGPSGDGGAHPACCRELYGTASQPMLGIALDEIEKRAVEVVNRSLAVTGVQRKLSLSLLEEEGHPHRLTVMGALGGTHILKPPAAEYPGMVELEHWTMRLARAAGLRAAACGRLPLSSGENAYVTRRFDREGARRIHVEDFCQLSGQPTADKYRSSLEKVGAIARRWGTVPGEDALRVYELAVFCLLTSNSDMHLKNWSFVRHAGRVELSPAYDLLPTRILTGDPEESALPVNGRKAGIRRRDLLALARHMRLPDSVATRVLDRLREAVPRLMRELPSPWTDPLQAGRLRELADQAAANLG